MVWQESDAAERFDEFFDAAVIDGPQALSRCGIEVAVLVSVEEWNALKAKSQNSTVRPESQGNP